MDIHTASDEMAAVIHNDQSPVIQMGGTLSGTLPFLLDEDPNGLSGKNQGADLIREFVNIQNSQALQRGNLGQIPVIGNDPPVQRLRQVE